MILERHQRPGEPVALSDAEFRALADYARSNFGLSLSEAKKPLIQSRLQKILQKRAIGDISAFISQLVHSENNGLREELATALTTNVTSFFREPHHFDSLRGYLEEVASQGREDRLRIWSAGCSTGEEPYSIAMTILDGKFHEKIRDIKILATDIDPVAANRARAGVYHQEATKSLRGDLLQRYFSRTDDGYSVAAAARALVFFNSLNLIEPWPMRGKMHAIFCRNVAIYFDSDIQIKLWHRFTEALVPGGFLFIGHSERVSGPASDLLEPCGVTTYRKK